MAKMLGLVLCLLAASWPAQSAQSSEGPIQFVRMQAMSSDDYSRPPPDFLDWYEVTLPDNWNMTRPDRGGGVWYRAPVDLPENATQHMGILLSNFSMNASIWWDGWKIVSGGQMEEPLSRNWHTPLYASLDIDRLKKGRHWLHIYIKGYPNDAAGIGNVSFGPESILLPTYNQRFFVQRTLSIIALACTILLAFGACLMWLLQSRQNVAFKWVFLAALTWSVVISNFVIHNPPMQRFYWESLVDGAIELYTLLMLLLVLQVLGLKKTLLKRTLALLFASGWMVILIFGNDAVLMAWAMPMHTLDALIFLYLLWLCVRSWLQQNNRNAVVLALVFLIQMVFAVHDWWAVYFANQLETVLIMQIGPTMMLFVITAWMLHGFSKSLQLSKTYTERIEAEVMSVTDRLKQEQAKMVQMQKQQALAEERERLTRELHDGVGADLATMSCMFRDGANNDKVMADMVAHALLDMRMVMDDIVEDCRDVGMIMGTLRHRFQDRMKGTGIKLSWNVQGLPIRCELFDRSSALHLMRIIQESLTNVIRHANADWVEVRASMPDQTDAMVLIEVIDNGQGIAPEMIPGKGLANMKQRAGMAKGTLDIQTSPQCGVHISLRLPVSMTD